VKKINAINEKEMTLDVSDEASWHQRYKDSAYIFAGGLDFELTEGDIIAVFSQYGEIVDINLVRDKATGKSKGFAFICYEDQRSTVVAVDNFNGITLCGRTVRVDHVNKYKPPKLDPKEQEKLKKKREKRELKEMEKQAKREKKDAAKSEKRKEKEKRKEEKRKKREEEEKKIEEEIRRIRKEEEERKKKEEDDGRKQAKEVDGKYVFAANWDFKPKEKRWEDMTEREKFFAEEAKTAPRAWNTPREQPVVAPPVPAEPKKEPKKREVDENGIEILPPKKVKKVLKITGLKLGASVPKTDKKKKDSLDYLTGEKPPEVDASQEQLEIDQMNAVRHSLGLKPLK